MIPPVATSILASNAQFDRLHAHLTTKLLNADASTRSTSTSYVATARQLNTYQVAAAREEILKRSLDGLVGLVGPDTLPPNLRDLVHNVSTYIAEAPMVMLSAEDHDLIKPEVDNFRNCLSEVSEALSNHLQMQFSDFQKTVHLAASKSTGGVAADPDAIIEDLQKAPSHKSQTTIENLADAMQLLTIQSDLLISRVTHLERHIHGTVSRYDRAKADHLAAVSAALALKTRVVYLQALKSKYSPDMQRALSKYSKHLDIEVDSLEDRKSMLLEILDEYEPPNGDQGSCGSDIKSAGTTVKELGRRYGEILREIEELEVDIERLEQGDSTRRR